LDLLALNYDKYSFDSSSPTTTSSSASSSASSASSSLSSSSAKSFAIPSEQKKILDSKHDQVVSLQKQAEIKFQNKS
jgi:hypothetical protein